MAYGTGPQRTSHPFRHGISNFLCFRIGRTNLTSQTLSCPGVVDGRKWRIKRTSWKKRSRGAKGVFRFLVYLGIQKKGQDYFHTKLDPSG
ncbi:hypothetical protein NPIL_395271 [Nephila pilipes]|uniref:Uncharacterized protein n=1 Tax=Nephila pilipes TaxID=299642 RepID=A0A8X6UMM1_NEPPI|nr:hypothetical protein NPIL_395271 [Nephila pilipes]